MAVLADMGLWELVRVICLNTRHLDVGAARLYNHAAYERLISILIKPRETESGFDLFEIQENSSIGILFGSLPAAFSTAVLGTVAVNLWQRDIYGSPILFLRLRQQQLFKGCQCGPVGNLSYVTYIVRVALAIYINNSTS